MVTIRKSLEERIAELQPTVEPRLRNYFSLEGIPFPPDQIVFVALKKEKQILIYAQKAAKPFILVKAYPILAASGHPGPKLREGDRQVPEGIYSVDFLNPNSLYHLSIKLNYPNEFDRRKAASDCRFSPGSNIMIHGNQVSSGCLAIGDEPIEDLFLLCAKVGIEKAKVIIAPQDFRHSPYDEILKTQGLPSWTEELYQLISKELEALPA